jgi:HlyD family secretion protein
MRRWWAVAVLTVVVLGVFLWRQGNIQPPEVSVAQATYGVLTVPFSAEGAVRGWDARISLPAPALTTEVPVREGESVRRGQALLRFWEGDLKSALQSARARLQAAENALREAQQVYLQARAQAHARRHQAEALVRAAEADLRLLERGARPEEIEQAQQEVDAAHASHELAQRHAERAARLHAQGALARAEYERALQEQRTAEARLKAAQARLTLLRRGARPEELESARARVAAARAELELAQSEQKGLRVLQERVAIARAALREAHASVQGVQRARELRTITAPRNAVVARILVESGESVAPGAPVIELIDPESLWVEAELTQEDAAKVQQGDRVRVRVPAFPGRRWEGVVASILPALERKPDSPLNVRILRVQVQVLKPPAELRPGMEASIEGEGRLGAETLLVPSDAVLEEPNRAWVWVIQDGVAHQRTVKVGYFTYNYTEITDGLRAGEWVVVHGKEGLKEGVRVRRRSQSP